MAETLEDRVTPVGRLFAAGAAPAAGGPSQIYELNPSTGAVLNSFNAPEPAGPGAVGLAFDGVHLFYLNGLGSDLLYELNPATGAVLDSDPITTGSGSYDGLAVVGGQVFIQDYALNKLYVFDPASDVITSTVTPTAATFGPDLAGGLAGATGPDGLIGPVNGGNLIAEFNPATGAIVSSFQPGAGPFLGAAVVDNVIYLGFGNTNAIRMYSRAGASLGQISIPVPVVALGGDGVSAPAPPTTDVVNGGFETGTTSGWTVFNVPGSSAPGFTTYSAPNPQQSSLPAPPEGGFAAYNGHSGPGSYILYQDITLPAGQAQTLSLTAFYQNQFTQGFVTPDTLDFRTGPNQQFRIDIVSPTGDLLATTSDVVKLNVFRTQAGDALSRGAFNVTADFGAFAGQTVRLRVAVTNNQFYFFGGVDNVHFAPSVPPSPGEVRGVKFHDLDADGVRDPGEPGLQGWKIYADVNLNGQPDAGEPSTLTGPDGSYSLAISPGNYRIRELNQGGWAQTSPLSFPLYSSGDNGATLISIDPATGTATRVGPFGAPNTLAGAFTSDGTYWTITNGFNSAQARLARVNLATGAATPAGDVLWTGSPIFALEGVLDTVLFGLNSNGQIVRIDTTAGTASVVGQSVSGLTDLAFDSARNLMWGLQAGPNRLARVDLSTGVVQSVVTITGLDATAQGLMFHPQTRVLYVTTAAGTLHTLDSRTGLATKVGTGLGVPAPSGGDFGRFNWHSVTVGSGQTITDRNFGDLPDAGTVTGVKYEDLDGDGARDPGEPGLPGWTVYADTNQNGRLDAGETTAVTGPDGSYALSGIPAGSYDIREAAQSGWVQTGPASGRLFAVRAKSGEAPVIVEYDADGLQVNQFAGPGVTATAGPQGLADGGSGLFYVDDSAGPVNRRLYELDPYSGTVRDSDPLPFAGGATGLGYLNGLVYVLTSSNQIVVFDPLTDTVVKTLQVPGPSFIGGLTGAGDLGLLFATSGSSIYAINPETGEIVRTLNPVAGTLAGGLAYRSGELLASPFTGSGPAPLYRINPQTGAVLGVLAANTDPVGALGGDGPVPGPHHVSLNPGQALAGRDFGGWRDEGTISGVMFNDLNGDGARSPDEPVLSGRTIFADANNNGTLDAGERSAVTGEDGAYALTLPSGMSTVRELPQAGWVQTSPSIGRLFALRVATGAAPTISELDATGGVLNSFTAPPLGGGPGYQGLADGGAGLFYIDGSAGPPTLYELDPFTGAVRDSDPLPAAAGASGLGYLNGLVYALTGANQIVVFDPAVDAVVKTLSVPAGLIGGLTGARDLGLLFATGGNGKILGIDPDTGAVVRTLSPNAGSLTGGLAYRPGELLATPFGSPGQTVPIYRIDPQTGAVLGILGTTGSVGGLGGDGAVPGAVRLRVTPGSVFDGRDFGSRVNAAPVAADDAASVGEDDVLTVAAPGVLANDSDPDPGESRVVTAVNGSSAAVGQTITLPSGSQVRLLANGSYTFAPAAGFNGLQAGQSATDAFTHTVTDGAGNSATATVTVTIIGANDAPVAADDAVTTDEDTAVTVPVLENDSDPDGDEPAIIAFTQGGHGTVEQTPLGLVYTPAANHNGPDSFTYTISDGHGGTATATVAVTTTPVNDAPAAANDEAVATEDGGAVAIDVLANDSDLENDALAVTATSQAAHGTVSFTATGVTYLPEANYHGPDSFTYDVSDGRGGTATGTVTVTVAPVNDDPTLDPLAGRTINEDAGVQTVSLPGITAGPGESQALTVTATSSNPALIPNPEVTYASPAATGTLTFSPAANKSGTATITVTVSDGLLTAQRTFAVTVTAVNDAPSFTAGSNQTVTAGTGPRSVAGWASNISAGPADEAGQGLTFIVTTSNPSLFVSSPAIDPATGTLSFIPEASATGTATVTAVLRDSGGVANGGSDTSVARTFTITVGPNGLPAAVGIRMVGSELVITGAAAADTVTVGLQGNRVRADATLNGQRFSQTFSGVTRVRVDAKGGNDTVTFAGNLTVPTWTDAGAGNDTVTGGGGADAIYLGDGNDSAAGGEGNDFIAGGAGEDLVLGGAGNDTVYAGADDDFVIGGAGADLLFGMDGNDILVGGSATVRNTVNDSLRKALTDWNPASSGVGGYANIRSRLTVTDDGTADRLAGGTGIDWFWEPLAASIDDLEPGEQQN